MRDIIIIGSVNYANFNDRDYFGKTPLHYAASSNNVEAVKVCQGIYFSASSF